MTLQQMHHDPAAAVRGLSEALVFALDWGHTGVGRVAAADEAAGPAGGAAYQPAGVCRHEVGGHGRRLGGVLRRLRLIQVGGKLK